MKIAFTTSSPMVQLVLLDGGNVCFERTKWAQNNASTLLASWQQEAFDELKIEWRDVQEIWVDYGPGSFTGVKVGVTMAKIWAYATGAKLFAVSSFDLIAPTGIVAIPHKRGSYCIRRPGEEPIVEESLPKEQLFGYGIEGIPERYPSFSLAEASSFLEISRADSLVPLYVAQPNISTPKQPYREA